MDPKQTPFFKAMQLCEGVLVILDKDATPFQRIWCCFEQATVAQGKKLLLDIATVHDGEPELLTDGFAYANPDPDDGVRDVIKFATLIKERREKHFPVGLLEKAYAIEVERGQASVEKERKLILNSITSTDPKAEPDPAHPASSPLPQHWPHAIGHCSGIDIAR